MFIDDDFTAKVGDFGMSKFDESNEADKSQITFTKVGPLKAKKRIDIFLLSSIAL